MSDIFDVAKQIARTSVREAAKETVAAFAEGKSLSGANIGAGAAIDLVEKKVSRIVEQDPVRHSWRAWGAVWATVAAVLAVPEVQIGLQAAIGSVVPVAWSPVVMAGLGAVWAGVSKVRDVRQIRGR